MTVTNLAATLQQNPALSLLIGGLMIGSVFGFTLQRTNFCAMGALSDKVVFGDGRRLRAWAVAALVALVGVQLLDHFNIIDTSRARYLGARINWLGHLAGGFAFGIGMVLAGGCASRNIVRAGSGDLRALLILLVVGLLAFATLSGVFGHMRVGLVQATAIDIKAYGFTSQHLGDVIAGLSTARPPTLRLTVISLAALALVSFIVVDRSFLTSPKHLSSGVIVGIAVIMGWALTSLVHDDFADRPVPLESLSFVAPLGSAMDWLQRATAIGFPGFAAALVFGTLVGSFAAAKLSGTFHLQTFANVDDTRRHLTGAALMGIGGVFALGCTIGQGISGLSTLSLGSLLSVAAIIVGAVTALKWMMR